MIVVIDTGVGSGFGGTLVGQACFAANADRHRGVLRSVGERPPGLRQHLLHARRVRRRRRPRRRGGSAVPVTVDAIGLADGTAVAAVAARHEPTPGVAPDAGVYAIRVFNPQGAFADLADIVLALDHVRRLVDAGLPVAAVNLSVSTISTFVGACDNIPSLAFEADAYRDVFDALLSRGIPTTVASGNGGSSTGIGFPACMSNAVSVGATDLDDDIGLFGNRGPGLDLMAPGARQGRAADDPRQRVLELGRDVVLRPARRGRLHAARRGLSQGLGGATAGAPRRQRRRGPQNGRTYRRLQLAPGQQMFAVGDCSPTARRWSPEATRPSATSTVTGAVISSCTVPSRRRMDLLRPTDLGSRADRAVGDRQLPTHRRQLPGRTAGRFRGRGRGDALLRRGRANDPLWQVSPTRTVSTEITQVAATFTSFVGDLDGDGWDDIVWYAPGTSAGEVWFGGATAFTVVARPVVGSYRVAVRDIDCDGRDEVYWHAPGSQVDRRWDVAADRSVTSQAAEIAGSYPVLVANLDGDTSGGHPCEDLVLHAARGARRPPRLRRAERSRAERGDRWRLQAVRGRPQRRRPRRGRVVRRRGRRRRRVVHLRR